MKEMHKIVVVGSGSWGTVLANMLSSNDLATCFYIRRKELFEEIETEKENKRYLPGIRLSSKLIFTNDLEYAMGFGDVVVLSVPVKYLRSMLGNLKPFLRHDHLFVSSSKGIENGTFFRPSEIIGDVLEVEKDKIAVISGPNFAKEVARKLPTATVLASHNRYLSKKMQNIFNSGYFRVYSSNDVVGVEIAGALKNVIAIASGISDGLGLGYNAKASLITRGLAEIMRFGLMLGAEKETFIGLAGIGDLVLTCMGDLSRNRKIGLELVKNRDVKYILNSMIMVAEGVNTVKSVFDWSATHDIDMPISKQVYEIIYNNKDPKNAAVELMGRPLKEEFLDSL